MSSNHFYNYIVSEIPVVSVCGKTKQVDFEKQQKKNKTLKLPIRVAKRPQCVASLPRFPPSTEPISQCVCPFSLRKIATGNEGDEGGMSLHPRMADSKRFLS